MEHAKPWRRAVAVCAPRGDEDPHSVREAIALATELGADRLARFARHELNAAGGRRSAALAGPIR